jgi:hypothetical protein
MFTKPLSRASKRERERHLAAVQPPDCCEGGDGLSCRDIHTHNEFQKHWLRNSKVHRGGYTDTQMGWRLHKPILEKEGKKEYFMLTENSQ